MYNVDDFLTADCCFGKRVYAQEQHLLNFVVLYVIEQLIVTSYEI